MTLTIHLYRRVMRRGRLLALLALSSVPALAFWLISYDSDAAEAAVLYSDIIATIGFSFAIAVLILTVAVLREERDSGTLPYIYMRPMRRSTMAASSIAAGILAALTLALGGWAMSLLSVLAVGAPASIALPGLAQFAAAGIGYAAVFVPLGYLVPRSILVGLGYIVVVETILANVVTGLAQLSIWRIALSIYADIATDFTAPDAIAVLGSVTPGVGGGIAKLAVVLGIGFGVLTWALQRRDAL
ncbi:MAG TPA: ABC transporter permease [Acidimicrobiia bacterium]|nr:ABC transporter permease [Acidimicrobiia bacterium]